MLAEYHTSGLGTLKFHMLDHVVDDLADLSGIQFSDASFYEHSHVYFKEMYRSTSKRRTTVMSETVTGIGERDALLFWMDQNHVMSNLGRGLQDKAGPRSMDSKEHRMKRDAYTHDTLVLPRNGEIFTLQDVRDVWTSRTNTVDTDGLRHAHDLHNEIGTDAMRCLEREVLSYCEKNTECDV